MELDIKILVAEDSPQMKTALLSILEGLGFYDITVGEDGSQALQHFLAAQNSGKPFDIILTDINMPNMTGVELLKTVRNFEFGKEIPIVMITTESEKDIVLDCIMSGASDYIIKPYDVNTAREKIITNLKKIK